MEILCILFAIVVLFNSVFTQDTNGIDDKDPDFTSNKLEQIPTEALRKHKEIVSILLSNNRIRRINKDSFPLDKRASLIYIDLSQNYIEEIDEDAFVDMPKLAEINLSRNKLKKFPTLKIPSLKQLLITENEIDEITKESMSHLKNLIHLDLRHNQIEIINAETFSANIHLVFMSFSSNPLKFIDDEALKGLDSLQILRLENTKIKNLPSKYGIQQIQKLYIKNTPYLFTIPNPENFKKIRIVEVTYPYHCCAFRATRKQDTIFNSSRPCNVTLQTTTTPTPTPDINKGKRSSNSTWDETMMHFFKDIFESFEGKDEDVNPCSSEGILVPGPPVDGHIKIECVPEPDAFTPCEDVMGTDVLRVFSWIISIFAIIGNVFQLIILFYNREELTVYKVLMYNLGLSNLLMGVYLIVLCCVDAHTYGEYYNYVQAWQYTGGCQALGFIGMFATQLSVCSLVLITVERFLLIIYALHVEKQMKLHHAKLAVLLSWLYSFIVAILPATNELSTFNKTAICLPMDVTTKVAIGYIVWLLLAYLIAFIAILGCYIVMYRSINESRPGLQTRTIEIQVAKRMAMIIFSNFFCWLPISIAGFMALYSGTDFNVKVAKFLLVFFFPLNACTNPFLYAIFTKVFREDTLSLLSSCGLFKQCINEENIRGRAPSYFKPKNTRANTNPQHFLHIQPPSTTYINPNREVQTEFESPETPIKLMSKTNNKTSKLERLNDHCSKPRSESTRGLLETQRYRTESNETTSTGQSIISEDEEFSRLIGSIQKNDPSILRV